MSVRGRGFSARIRTVDKVLSRLSSRDRDPDVRLALQNLRQYRDLLVVLQGWDIGSKGRG